MLGTGKPSNKFYIPKNIGYTVKTIIALGEQVEKKIEFYIPSVVE